MITSILAIFWLHFIADFVLQNDKMALNKSKSFKWLSIHALVYSIPFLIYFSFAFDPLFGLTFALINGILHWLVDAVTSRVTAYLWKKKQRHAFFEVIGLDQAIHMTCLVVTFKFIHTLLVYLALIGAL